MTPSEHLGAALTKAVAKPDRHSVRTADNRGRVERVASSAQNRACVRLVMACLLAKLDRPDTDPRRPYTEITEPGAFSGRRYDEDYITRFVTDNRLPCNSTTAFLTPALRSIDYTLTPDRAVIGRPRELYADALHLLNEVAQGREKADAVLTDLIRVLLRVRTEHEVRLSQLQAELWQSSPTIPLSSEGIVTLIEQHLKTPNTSRLPVLIVAAAYQSAAGPLGETAKPLTGHNAADAQTGAVGDIEVTLVADDRIVTVYEMKRKAVAREDIDRAIQKIVTARIRPDNYIFVTTDPVDRSVTDYAASQYNATRGVEFAILDCLGFLRHFLHLFHRHRVAFLDRYQELVLADPNSAVSFEVKQSFLVLRRAAGQPPATE